MSFLINSAFTADDVDVLRTVVNCWCAEKRIDIKSTEAQFAASAALDLFQSGHTTSERLLVAMRAHQAL